WTPRSGRAIRQCESAAAGRTGRWTTCSRAPTRRRGRTRPRGRRWGWGTTGAERRTVLAPVLADGTRDGHEPGDVVDVLRLFLTHVQRYVDVAHQVGRERRSEGRAVKDAAIPLLVDVSPLQADED